MKYPEQDPTKATGYQAQALLGHTGMLATMQGHMDGSNTSLYEAIIDETPPDIALHLPRPNSDSVSTVDSLYTSQILDVRSGHPKLIGLLAQIKLTRSELAANGNIYRANVLYQIYAEGERDRTFDMRRRISYAIDKPTQAPAPESTTSDTADRLWSLTHQGRMLGNAGLEQTTSIAVVTKAEAGQLLDMMSGLNSLI